MNTFIVIFLKYVSLDKGTFKLKIIRCLEKIKVSSISAYVLKQNYPAPREVKVLVAFCTLAFGSQEHDFFYYMLYPVWNTLIWSDLQNPICPEYFID